MNVQMADLPAQYRELQDEINAALAEVLEGCRFILGPNVVSLEQEIAEMSGAVHGIGVASGTDALMLSLAACGVGPGDEVITSPFTFVATCETIAQLGAKPVFADIDPVSFNLKVSDVEALITPRTKVILPVHLFGQLAVAEQFDEIASRHNLHVIYDGAQAIGARRGGKKLAEFGVATTLSFFPTKNLGAFGDGGMILTSHDELAKKMRSLRFHGSGGNYYYDDIGWCSRLDEMQAAILRVKLRHLDEWNQKRTGNAAYYTERLAGCGLVLPKADSANHHVWHQYTVRVEKRDELLGFLKERGIASAVYYPAALHLQPAYSYLGYSEGDFPEAERACQEVLSLPVIPELTEQAREMVADAVLDFQKSPAAAG